MSHFIEVCAWGYVISQCRCPSKDKEIRRTPCDGTDHNGVPGPHGRIDVARKEPEYDVGNYRQELSDALETAWQKAVGQYTVFNGPHGNLDRVVMLATDDLMAALRPVVKAIVQDRYKSVEHR